MTEGHSTEQLHLFDNGEPRKRCTLCGMTKPLAAFHKDRKIRDGRRNQCGKCMREREKKNAGPRIAKLVSQGVTTRTCKVCKIAKPFEEFLRGNRCLGKSCRTCHHEKHRPLHRKISLRNKFGITVEQYASMLAEQNGVCAICNNPERMMRGGKLQSLAVDHDHSVTAGKTRIRGLLCCNCNQAIGHFFDNIQLLKNAIAYLERYQTPA